MHRFDLSGKVALVTGGIGQGIASGLLECGAAVAIAGRNEEKNKNAVGQLAAFAAFLASPGFRLCDRGGHHGIDVLP